VISNWKRRDVPRALHITRHIKPFPNTETSFLEGPRSAGRTRQHPPMCRSQPGGHPSAAAAEPPGEVGKSRVWQKVSVGNKKTGLNYYSTHSLHKENRSSRLRPVFIFDREPDKWQAACSDKALLWA